MSRPFSPTILRFDALPSTNTEAARQAALGAPEGLCIVAREQTEGRGRRERAWVSPKDAGLYFSVVLRPRIEPRAWTLLPLMAALAASDALREACSLATDIKWPNDLLAGGRKLCGILVESVETPHGRAAIAGTGINLTRAAFPAELSERAVSVEELTGKPVGLEELLRALVRATGQRYARLQAEGGAQQTLSDWAQRSTYAEGKRVRVALEDESFEGTTRGLAADGALRVETTDRHLRIVYAGDVTAVREK